MKKLILSISLVAIFAACDNNEEIELDIVSNEVVASEVSAFLSENSNSNIDFRQNGIIEIIGKYYKIEKIEFSGSNPNSRTECDESTLIYTSGCQWYFNHCQEYADVCCLNGSGGVDCMEIMY